MRRSRTRRRAGTTMHWATFAGVPVAGTITRADEARPAAVLDYIEAPASGAGDDVIDGWSAPVLDQRTTGEEARLRHDCTRFVDAMVAGVEHRRTRKEHSLYNIGVADDESYVAAGVVSHNCRPPGNRNPEADELEACAPFLAEQLATLQPKVVLSLGSVATHALLKTNTPIGKLRGRLHPYGDAVLIPTFHPAFLLRNPGQEYKRMAWEDLKLARREYDRRRAR